jgi:hypothetical protein
LGIAYSRQSVRETSLSIPGELAARASFLARPHRETGIDKWVERVIRERVELEERAFTEAKKELASYNKTFVSLRVYGRPLRYSKIEIWKRSRSD